MRGGSASGVSEIARRTQLSKATVHHLLATLETRGWVMRAPDSPLYKLGWAPYEIGSNVVRSVDLVRIARPYLDRLAAQTGESVLLGILDEDSVLYLDRGEAPDGLRMVANSGRRGSLHASASGKVLLAFAADSALVNRRLSGPLPALTPSTVTEPMLIRRDMAEIRRQGYATCWQEQEIGLCSVAVPVRDHRGATLGSLSIAGPAERLNKDSLRAHLVPLRAVQRRIEAHTRGSIDSATH